MKKTGKRGLPQGAGQESSRIKSTLINPTGLNFRVQSIFPRRRGAEIQSEPQNSNRLSIKPIVLIFSMGFFQAGCFPSPFPSPSEIAQQSQGDSKRGRDRSRFTVKDKSCNENKECPDLCEIVFERRTERDDCEERTVSEVREFKRIHYFLQGKNAEGADLGTETSSCLNPTNSNPNPNPIKEEYFGNLNRIVAEDLEDMISISENPETLVDDVPDNLKPTFRTWLANNQDIAEILRDEDEDFAAFKEILGSTCSTVNTALNAKGYIEKPDGICHSPDDIAIRAGNRDFLQWIHDYLSTISGASPPDPKTLINNNGPPSNNNWCNPTY